SGLEHYELAVRLFACPPARLFVNDRLDVALAAGAAGVQLGQGSLEPEDARRLNPAWWIGKSVHDLREAQAAHAGGADYLLVGPGSRGGAGGHAARAAGVARARAAGRGGGAQPRGRAAAAARRGDGRTGRCDRAGAFRRRGLSMTTAVETMQDTPFTIGGRSFHSRLMVGTGKYRDNDTMARAIDASGAEIVTVAVRRVDLDRTKEEGVLDPLDAKRY